MAARSIRSSEPERYERSDRGINSGAGCRQYILYIGISEIASEPKSPCIYRRLSNRPNPLQLRLAFIKQCSALAFPAHIRFAKDERNIPAVCLTRSGITRTEVETRPRIKGRYLMSIISVRHNCHSIFRLQGGGHDATDRNIWQPAPVDHIPTQKKRCPYNSATLCKLP